MGDTEAKLLVESPLGTNGGSLGLGWSEGHTRAGREGHSRQARSARPHSERSVGPWSGRQTTGTTLAQACSAHSGTVISGSQGLEGQGSHAQAGQSPGPHGAKHSGNSHTGREVSEGHTGTGVVSGSHTGSGISRVTRGLFSRWAAVPEAAPLTVSLAAQRRESVVKEMQPESARPKPLSTRW